MEIQRLDRCPRCKGRLLREKDIYGLYEQCMQCGYIHDLQTLGWVDMKKAEASHRVTAEISDDEPQGTPQLTGYVLIEFLRVPPILQLLMNQPLKERKNNHHLKKPRHRSVVLHAAPACIDKL